MIYFVISFVSLIIGIFIGKYTAASKFFMAKELRDTKEELATLKAKLKHHFSENVVLFKQLDDSYQKLFKQFGDTVDDISESIKDSNVRQEGTLERLTDASSQSDKEHSVQQPKDYQV